jgi:hypothetical protein
MHKTDGISTKLLYSRHNGICRSLMGLSSCHALIHLVSHQLNWKTESNGHEILRRWCRPNCFSIQLSNCLWNAGYRLFFRQIALFTRSQGKQTMARVMWEGFLFKKGFSLFAQGFILLYQPASNGHFFTFSKGVFSPIAIALLFYYQCIWCSKNNHMFILHVRVNSYVILLS